MSQERWDRARLLTATNKVRRRRARYRDAGEASTELVVINGARARGRVIQEPLAVSPALDDEEVVHLPEDDDRQRTLLDAREAVAVRVDLKAVASGSPHYGACIAAVTGYSAGLSKVLERDPPAKVRQHDRQRRSATFDRFHLQDRGCLHPRLHMLCCFS